jgi:hypothetical protein
MQSSPQSAQAPQPAPPGGRKPSTLIAERAYQGLTIASMLLLLASLWLFW